MRIPKQRSPVLHTVLSWQMAGGGGATIIGQSIIGQSIAPEPTGGTCRCWKPYGNLMANCINRQRNDNCTEGFAAHCTTHNDGSCSCRCMLAE